MTSGWIIFCEIALVLGLALVFGIREIVGLRRADRKPTSEKTATRSDGAS